jgi:hypothetical protein
MSRFILDEESSDRISRLLPEINSYQLIALSLLPDIIAFAFPENSRIPIAAICFQDIGNKFGQIRFALGEYYSHKIWFGEKNPEGNSSIFLFTRLFFLEDIALRLYSIGEDLANSIINSLEITDAELEPYKNGRISQQSILGNYLMRERPDIEETKIIKKLIASEHWARAINYRNRLVHEQPPSVSGMGQVYTRRPRWQPTGNANEYAMGIGLGEEPEYSIDEIELFITEAYKIIIEITVELINIYTKWLENHRFTIRPDGTGISYKMI